MGLALRNQEAVTPPRLNVLSAQMNPRRAGEQDKNLVLVVVHMKRRRVAEGRMMLHYAGAVLTKLWRNPYDDKGIDKPESLQTIVAHGLAQM